MNVYRPEFAAILRISFHIKRYPFALIKLFKTIILNSGEMHEYVVTAIIV